MLLMKIEMALPWPKENLRDLDINALMEGGLLHSQTFNRIKPAVRNEITIDIDMLLTIN